jgi:hypothetical protein
LAHAANSNKVLAHRHARSALTKQYYDIRNDQALVPAMVLFWLHLICFLCFIAVHLALVVLFHHSDESGDREVKSLPDNSHEIKEVFWTIWRVYGKFKSALDALSKQI